MIKQWRSKCIDCGFPDAHYSLISLNNLYSISINCPACMIDVTAICRGDIWETLCPRCFHKVRRSVSWVGGSGWRTYYACQECGYVLSDELTRLVDRLHSIAREVLDHGRESESSGGLSLGGAVSTVSVEAEGEDSEESIASRGGDRATQSH